MLKSLTRFLDDTFYPNATKYWDNERFVEDIRSHLKHDSTILDFGAGRGNLEMLNFQDDVARVIGVDIDEDILQNPFLDEKHVITPNTPLPLKDASIDLVFSCNVLEHLADPEPVFSEIQRVLKPGGILLAKTTNRNHYISLVARMTPLWFHKWFNQKRGRETIDTFPTTYLCNSKPQLKRLAQTCGFEIEILKFLEWRPEYLRLTPPTYIGGIAYERIVNSTALLSPYRAVLIVGMRKP